MSGEVDGVTLARKSLPLRLLVFQSFSMMAPAAAVGIFLTGTAGLAGGSTPLVVLLGMILFFLGLNANYQFSKNVVSAGGYYSFVGTALNKSVGFFAGSLYGIAALTSLGVFGILQFVAFAYFLFPSFASYSFLPYLLILVSAAVEISLVYFGIRPNLRYMTITGSIESAILIVGSIAIIILKGSANTLQVFTPSYVNGFGSLFLPMILAMEFFVGAGSVITLAEESKNPTKDIGKAFMIVLAIGAIPILLASYAFTIGWGPTNMASFASSPDPGVVLYQKFLGSIAAILFAIFVMNSAISVGIANANAGTRTAYGMAREGLFPSYFNYIHPKYKTPTRIILLVGILDVVLAIVAVATLGVYNGFFVAAVFSTVPVMIVHAITNLSLPFYMRKLKLQLTSARVLTHYVIPAVAFVGFALVTFFSVVPLPSYPNVVGIWADIVLLVGAIIGIAYLRARKPHILKGSPMNLSQASEAVPVSKNSKEPETSSG
jgi:amino acid transporter